MTGMPEIRRAVLADLAPIERLVARSFKTTIRSYYSARQTGQAMTRFGKIDASLVGEGRFYVAVEAGAIIGCGAWSTARELVAKNAAADFPDSIAYASEGAATLRSFFVDPGHTRRGIAAAIFARCRAAARNGGYRRLELLAAASSMKAFVRLGFADIVPVELVFDKSIRLASYRMGMDI